MSKVLLCKKSIKLSYKGKSDSAVYTLYTLVVYKYNEAGINSDFKFETKGGQIKNLAI
jgi:hypothetical protein